MDSLAAATWIVRIVNCASLTRFVRIPFRDYFLNNFDLPDRRERHFIGADWPNLLSFIRRDTATITFVDFCPAA
jgi:hypothetical protein